MVSRRQRLGGRGERWARWYLRCHGYRILARNVDTPYAEVDIVARKGATLHVIEVKTRRQAGETIVRLEQRRRLRRAAHWLAGRAPKHWSTRIDIVAIHFRRYWPLPRVELVVAAFGDEVAHDVQ